MKNLGKKMLLCLGVSVIISVIAISATAEPTVNNINTNPEKPEPQSTVTVIANISGENITSVTLFVLECNYNTEQCYVSNNYEMELNSEGKYVKTLALEDTQGRTDHIQYFFTVMDSGTEYQLTDDSWLVDLDIDSNKNDSKDDNQNSDNGTPGFEFIFVIIALFISMLFIYKKR